MSIWGKLTGALTGFAIGGPAGALIGAVAGHFVLDQSAPSPAAASASASAPTADANKQLTYLIALIALSAKMAKADGVVHPAEIRAFHDVLKVPPENERLVAAFYNFAQRDASGYEMYARQAARAFADAPAVLRDMLDALFHIARADGVIHAQEMEFLQRVAAIFGLPLDEFHHMGSDAADPDLDPYAVLGLQPGATDAQIHATWRRLVREHHPDGMRARGVPAELVHLASDRLAVINAAHDRIRKMRQS